MARSRHKIIILIVLVGLIVFNKPLLVTASDHFVPKSEGEVWEKEIKLTPEKQSYVVLIQMRAFAQYHVSVSIDRFSDISVDISASYIFKCRYSTRAEPKINNEPFGERGELFFHDGESISFLLNSTVHLIVNTIKVAFNDFHSTKEFPTEGFHGKITIKMVSLGMTDNSWYRTVIKLNQTIPAFTFSLGGVIYDTDALDIGYGAKAQIHVSSSLESTSSISINTSEFTQLRNYSDFSYMEINPGGDQHQDFTLYNSQGDMQGDVTFSVELINHSAKFIGNLTVYFLQRALYFPNFGLNVFTMTFAIVILLLLKRKKASSCD